MIAEKFTPKFSSLKKNTFSHGFCGLGVWACHHWVLWVFHKDHKALAGTTTTSRLDSKGSTSKTAHMVAGFPCGLVEPKALPLCWLLAEWCPSVFCLVSLSWHGSWFPLEQASKAEASLLYLPNPDVYISDVFWCILFIRSKFLGPGHTWGKRLHKSMNTKMGIIGSSMRSCPLQWYKSPASLSIVAWRITKHY